MPSYLVIIICVCFIFYWFIFYCWWLWSFSCRAIIVALGENSQACVPHINEAYAVFSMDFISFVLNIVLNYDSAHKESSTSLLTWKAGIPWLGFYAVINSCSDLFTTLLYTCALQRHCTNNAFKEHFSFIFSFNHEWSFVSNSQFNCSTPPLDLEFLGLPFTKIVPGHIFY